MNHGRSLLPCLRYQLKVSFHKKLTLRARKLFFVDGQLHFRVFRLPVAASALFLVAGLLRIANLEDGVKASLRILDALEALCHLWIRE